jgi:hypothetical protein
LRCIRISPACPSVRCFTQAAIFVFLFRGYLTGPEVRKATLASVQAKASPGIRFNEHIEGDGPTVFAHACKMGLEGIVSKRKDSAYRSGRSPDWLKMTNPACVAVKREAEEDWGR